MTREVKNLLDTSPVFTDEPPELPIRLDGGPGADELTSLFYRAELFGGEGPDNLYAGPEDDLLDGGEGPDSARLETARTPA